MMRQQMHEWCEREQYRAEDEMELIAARREFDEMVALISTKRISVGMSGMILSGRWHPMEYSVTVPFVGQKIIGSVDIFGQDVTPISVQFDPSRRWVTLAFASELSYPHDTEWWNKQADA